MTRSVDIAVVGGGQAGLVVSRLLREAGRESVVLERRMTVGGGWQDRWEAFRLVSPNWTVSVPGLDYEGPEPDGFMPRDELIAHWRRYAETIRAPLELGTDVTKVATHDGPGPSRFELTTSRGKLLARSVIVATGPFQRPHVPVIADRVSPTIRNIHAHAYRDPVTLPPGGVLLIGAGQTGVQLAEELHASGRAVTLAVGSCGRMPRRYRGHDIFWWLRQLGTVGPSVGASLPTADRLPSPAARFACNPHLSGHDGGHTVNLRRMAAQGVRLVGRLEGIEDTIASFRDDLADNLAFADRFFDERLRPLCDTFAERVNGDFPVDRPDQFDFDVPAVARLDLAREGITTVIWTSGYRPEFSWLDPPVLDTFGLPVQDKGWTATPGLGFIGTPWLVDMGSANLVGLVRDAEMLVAGL
jgi:putative flavoprotein involved in K+ transport